MRTISPLFCAGTMVLLSLQSQAQTGFQTTVNQGGFQIRFQSGPDAFVAREMAAARARAQSKRIAQARAKALKIHNSRIQNTRSEIVRIDNEIQESSNALQSYKKDRTYGSMIAVGKKTAFTFAFPFVASVEITTLGPITAFGAVAEELSARVFGFEYVSPMPESPMAFTFGMMIDAFKDIQEVSRRSQAEKDTEAKLALLQTKRNNAAESLKKLTEPAKAKKKARK